MADHPVNRFPEKLNRHLVGVQRLADYISNHKNSHIKIRYIYTCYILLFAIIAISWVIQGSSGRWGGFQLLRARQTAVQGKFFAWLEAELVCSLGGNKNVQHKRFVTPHIIPQLNQEYACGVYSFRFAPQPSFLQDQPRAQIFL